jgi:hypothetical protein
LLIGAGCVMVAAWLYVCALASASAFGTFSSFSHPWQNFTVDVLLLCLSVFAVIWLVALMRGGTRLQQRVAMLLAVLPLGILVHFGIWVACK